MINTKTKRILSLSSSIIILVIILSGNTLAQVPTTQDCKGAIPVCDYIYVEEFTATGNGNYNEIPAGGNGCPNHCMDGEHNSRWYIWTVIESGDLRFEITPQMQTDDYDWSVFDLTQNDCDDIWNNVGSILSSCNAAGGTGYHGATGISTWNGGTSSCNNGGPTNKWNADLPVNEGETYVLVVSDWTQSPGGYTLDFSTSTAVIFDTQEPSIDYIGGDLITSCGTNELVIEFNENVKCSSIQASDFILDGPGGPYVLDSIYGENCELGGSNERDYILYLTPAIYQGGDFTLELKQFSFISDACNNYAVNEIYDFTIDLDSPDANAGDDIDIPYAATASLDGSASNGSGNYFYTWEPAELLDNPTIANPTTVTLTSSTEFILSVSDQESACVGEDTMWVNVVGGPLGISMSVSSNEICNEERVDLDVFPNGGSGSYNYSWTSNPSGFNSTVQNPSDYPVVDTWYVVNVTDGFTVLLDSIFVIVNQLPISNAGEDQIINEGTSTVLSGSGSGGNGNYSYQWEPSSWLEISNIANPPTLPLYEPTVFSLWITDDKNCTSISDNVLINASEGGLSAFPWSDSSVICFGESTTIVANASGGGLEYSYEWTSEPIGFTSSSNSIYVTPLETTKYNLLLKDQFNNEFETYIIITVNPLPEINLKPENAITFGIDTIIACVRDTIVLDAGYDEDPPNSEYFWIENNYQNRFNTASTNGNWIVFQTHSVLVTNGYTGCKNTGAITILFSFDECSIGIDERQTLLNDAIVIQPNPNNGNFKIRIKEKISDLEISIYNTVGELVLNEKLDSNQNHSEAININSGFEPGVYIVRFSSGGESIIKKIIVN